MESGACRCCTFSDAQLERPLLLQMIPLKAAVHLVYLRILRHCGGFCCGHGSGKTLCVLDQALLLLPQELDVARGKVADARVGLHIPPSGRDGGAGDDPGG